MLTEERYKAILAAVSETGAVTVTGLSELLGASESTIRRDLIALDHMHKLLKVHGGATSVSSQFSTTDLSIDARYEMNTAEKRAIAAYAASLITPDDFVYVDAGSTTEAFCDAVTETHATYVTNSIMHASKLVSKGCCTLVLGGELKDATRATVGPDAVDGLSRYHFTKGFWGTNGASPEDGFTTPEVNEGQIKRLSMRRCSCCYILCDTSKFKQISPVKFADFYDATIICEETDDPRIKRFKNVAMVATK